MGDQRMISVGIGEIQATKDPFSVLITYGLGSCVGISIYDKVARVGGIAHVLLPSSKDAEYQGAGFRFADIAVPTLIQQVTSFGAVPRRLVCKIAGGAQVLTAPGRLDSFRIGQRNVDAVREALDQWGVAPVAMETGGSKGRTLRLVIATGQVFVRTAGQKEIEL